MNEVPEGWQPKSRYPDFWAVSDDKREAIERFEMAFAESQCLRARHFAKRTGAFGRGKNIPYKAILFS